VTVPVRLAACRQVVDLGRPELEHRVASAPPVVPEHLAVAEPEHRAELVRQRQAVRSEAAAVVVALAAAAAEQTRSMRSS